VNDVVQYVREFYFEELSTQPSLRQSGCGQGKGGASQKMLDCANQLTQQKLESSVFNRDMDCSDCHEITKSGDTISDWKFAPLNIKRDWFQLSVFSHSKHNATDCTTCHVKNHAKSRADMSMPSIQICRECHIGNQEEKYKISSGCDTCHKFHNGKTHVWTKRQATSSSTP
jgi:hypothetical protein